MAGKIGGAKRQAGSPTRNDPITHNYAHVDWSPDGEWLATHREFVDNAGDATVKLWKPNGTAGPVRKVDALGIKQLTWRPNGKELAVIADRQRLGGAPADCFVELLRVDGVSVWKKAIDEYGTISHLAWHPQGDRLAILAENYTGNAVGSVLKGLIRIVDSTGEILTDIQFAPADGSTLRELAWSPDGKVLGGAFIARYGLWHTDGTPVVALKETGGIGQGDGIYPITKLFWSPDSQYLLCNDDRLFRADGSQVDKNRKTDFADFVGWSSDSQTVHVLHPRHGLVTRRLDGTFTSDVLNMPSTWSQPGTTASWHPRSPAFVAGPANGFRWWTLDGRPGPVMASGNKDFSPLMNNGSNVCCSPDGSTILSAYGGFCAFRDRHRVTRYQRLPITVDMNRMAWSPDGKRMVLGSNEGAAIVTFNSPEIVALGDSPRHVADVDWSPDGQWIATAEGNQVRLWKPDGTPGNTLEFSSQAWVVKWHPNSRELAVEPSMGNVTYQLMQIDGTPGASLRKSLLDWGYLRAAWSRDGRLLVTGDRDDTYKGTHLVAWKIDDESTAWQSALIPHHASGLRKLEWGADDQHLLTQAADGTFGVWNGRTGELQWLIACPTDQDAFSFDAAGQLLHGDPTKLDAWFRCVIEEPEGTFKTLTPSEFLQQFPEFITPGSWPEDGKQTDPERKAAARLLEIGCTLGVYVGGVGRMVKTVNDLPRERFSIVMITGPLTDGDLVWLHKNRQTFEELFRLDLAGGNNTDQGIKLLKDFPDLWSLNVAYPTKIGPGLEIPQLTCLDLNGPNVTVQTIAHLKALPDLMELTLTSQSITDEAIDELIQLENLLAVYDKGTKLTPAGIARLKAALPLCEVQGP